MSRSPLRVLVPLSLASMALYLAFSYFGGFVGFPLDDGWIHQTYARNLAWRQEFSFVPGQPSAGSTSPLWSALLAPGYLLRVDPRAWTFGLGAALLALNGWLAYRLVMTLWPGPALPALLAGMCVTLEWHLVWAAASGMEILLFSALALAVFVMPVSAPGAQSSGGWRAARIGLTVGLSVLARPDGLTLLPFALARMLAERPRRVRRALYFALGLAVVLVPYLAFNQWLAGSPWPNTFYAKAAEYAELRAASLPARVGRLALAPLVGAVALLVPGILLAAWQWLSARKWTGLLALGWAGALVGAYALRLPVTYQHGRYLMPVIPVLVSVGVGGLAQLLRLRAPRLAPRVLSRTWLAATALVLAAFWLLGARAYARDVQIIETEMVATAHWVRQHTPPHALLAAHDIGALGFFGERRLLDLAGLVSPEVIPFIRDEDRLRDWLRAAEADYLITFPAWYPRLVSSPEATEVYRTRAPYSPAAGGENMVVYRWARVPP